MKNIISCKVSSNLCKIGMKWILQNLEKFKIAICPDDLWWTSSIKYHLVTHLGWQPLPEITIMTPITHAVNIETCNKNQQTVGQSLTSTCCQPSWIEAIIRNHTSGCHCSQSHCRDLQQKSSSSKFGSIFNFNMLSALLDTSHYQTQ